MKNLFIFFACIYASISTFAQILGPSAQEVQFKYRAQFQIPVDSDYATDLERAEFHASHLFGLLQSKAVVRKYDLMPFFVGGLGAPKSPSQIKIISSKEIENNLIEIEYENKGQLILHKEAAAKILEDQKIILPMPVNPYESYDKNCTDEHYDSFGDYWYFYDVYKKGCVYLSKAPYATDVLIDIALPKTKKIDLTMKRHMLRGDNGNGEVFSIAMIHGFADDTKDPDDSGRINFKEMNDFFIEQGFAKTNIKSKSQYPLFLFTKDVQLTNGKTIKIEIQHLLVETAIESRSKIFATFFKDAVFNADVIIYAGHSGLGGNLDIPSLEAKVGAFEFNKNKKQIFYFDSCSSYSYYLEHFKVEKTKAKIDIMTNGLSSYFHTAQATMSTFMKHLISEDSQDIEWQTVLGDMENQLKGETYLLNVGGI